MILKILCLFCVVKTIYSVFTLDGDCPNMKLHKDMDYAKFSGIWYTVAVYASDSRTTTDCSILEFQEDNIGFTLNETYVEVLNGSRTQQTYNARVDPTFDAGNYAHFIISTEENDKVLQYPFDILATDYESFAIAYTCKRKKKPRKHRVFTWILSRNTTRLDGVELMKVRSTLAKYVELSANWESFVFKDFTKESCDYSLEAENNTFTKNFL